MTSEQAEMIDMLAAKILSFPAEGRAENLATIENWYRSSLRLQAPDQRHDIEGNVSRMMAALTARLAQIDASSGGAIGHA